MRIRLSELKRAIRKVILERRNLQDYLIMDWLEDNTHITDDVQLLELAKRKFSHMLTEQEIEECVMDFVEMRMGRYDSSKPTVIKGRLPR